MHRLTRVLAQIGILLLLLPALLSAPRVAQAYFECNPPTIIPPVPPTPPAPEPELPPVVTGITISGPRQVTAGGQVRFTVSATTDTTESITVQPAWTATGGTLVSWGPSVVWTAPTKVGTYTVGASYGRFTASQTVTVVPAAAVTLSLSPAGPLTVQAGQTLTFAGAAADVYGNPIDTFTWSVTGVGSVDNGAFRSLQVGRATVTATSGDRSASVQLTVAPGPVARVTLTPAGALTTETGEALQFTAAAADAYGNPVDAPAAWSSSGVDAVLDGRFRATRPGTATVTAQVGGVSGTSGTITVNPGLAPAGTADAGGAPVRIDITPTPEGAYVIAGPVLVQGTGTVSIRFPVGQATGDTLLVYRYDARLKAWIALPTLVAAGQALATVPTGVPVALLRTAITQPNDVAGALERAAILKVTSLGLMNGYPDGSFRPGLSLTRYQLAAVLVRLQHLDTAHADLSVLDRLADGWQIPEGEQANVAAVLQAGLMQGAIGRFSGEQTLTRAQLAVVVARLLGPGTAPAAGLPDVPAWARAAVDRVVAAGLMAPTADGSFHAEAVVTRGDLARVLAALVDVLAPRA